MSEDAPKARKQRATAATGRRLYRDAALKQGRGFTPDKQADYLAAIARGLTRSKAAVAADVSTATVRDYMKKDPAFAAAVVEAEAQACDEVEDVLRELALSGHMTALMFWLQNRAPDRWKDMRRVEKKVTHEGTVTHELEAGATMQRIAQLQATLEERRALRAAPSDRIIDAQVVDE